MQNETDKKNVHHLIRLVIIAVVGCLFLTLKNRGRINYKPSSTAINNSTSFNSTQISFVIALARLFCGIAQLLSGVLVLKRTNSIVLALETLMMSTGFVLTLICNQIILETSWM